MSGWIAPLEAEVDSYLAASKSITTDGDGSAILLTAPVEGIPGQFTSLEQIPGNLPPLPEDKMDFAFRYATEYHQITEWAKILGKGESTVSLWLRDPVVGYYIAMIRYERRAYNAAVLLRIERVTLAKLYEILTTKLNADNMGLILQAIKYVMDFLSGNRLPASLGNEVRKAADGERKMIGDKMAEHGERIVNEDEESRVLSEKLREIEQVEAAMNLHTNAGGNGSGSATAKGTDVGGVPPSGEAGDTPEES